MKVASCCVSRGRTQRACFRRDDDVELDLAYRF